MDNLLKVHKKRVKLRKKHFYKKQYSVSLYETSAMISKYKKFSSKLVLCIHFCTLFSTVNFSRKTRTLFNFCT